MFDPWHIPALFVASALTFGGMWPYFDATSAIQDFGLPKRIANSKEARGVFLVSASRTTVIGAIMFAFYFQDKLADVDTVMVILGSYVGAADGYVCWREGVPDKAVFRSLSGLAIAVWGWYGMTTRT